MDVAAPQGQHPVVDLDGGRDGDDERRGGEEEPEIRVHAAHIHVVRPYDEAEGADGHDRPHHHAIAEDVLARVGAIRSETMPKAGRANDVDLGMAEEPEQVLEQDRAAAAVLQLLAHFDECRHEKLVPYLNRTPRRADQQRRGRPAALRRWPKIYFHGHRPRVAGLPRLVRRLRDDAVRQGPGDQLFHAGHCRDGNTLKYRGGSPLLFQHLFWFFGHPEVYIVALPAFGIVSDLISTHARKNIFGYRMMVWAIVAIGALSFVVWAHHMYVSGMNPYFGFFFATTTLIIAIPTAIKVYNWVLTLWRGDIHLTVPMLFALSFIVTFVNGGLTGLFLGNVVVDVPLSDTMFVVAHFHMVMGMAPIFVIFGAIYHWYPKVTGRMLNEMLGKFHFWVTFLGAYAIYFPMHYIGLLGVPRRYFEMGDMAFVPQSATTLNIFITMAALIVGFAQMVFLFNMIWSLFKGKPAGSNPWRATTLEWQTPETPPGHGNWGKELPVVYRWAYDYSVPGAKEDFVPQNQPAVARAA